jgi:hypothetical protein
VFFSIGALKFLSSDLLLTSRPCAQTVRFGFINSCHRIFNPEKSVQLSPGARAPAHPSSEVNQFHLSSSMLHFVRMYMRDPLVLKVEHGPCS